MLYDPLIDRLIAAFPACFSRLPKPLKIGLGEELLALAGVHPALADLTRTRIRRALKFYTQRPAYRRALARVAPATAWTGNRPGRSRPSSSGTR